MNRRLLLQTAIVTMYALVAQRGRSCRRSTGRTKLDVRRAIRAPPAFPP